MHARCSPELPPPQDCRQEWLGEDGARAERRHVATWPLRLLLPDAKVALIPTVSDIARLDVYSLLDASSTSLDTARSPVCRTNVEAPTLSTAVL